MSEVAQIWADQCANVIYQHSSDTYPKIFHERGSERMTSRFNSPPGKDNKQLIFRILGNLSSFAKICYFVVNLNVFGHFLMVYLELDKKILSTEC